MSLKNYLERHFVDKRAFADMAGVSPERIDQLIASGAVPAATYVCDGESIWSAVFGFSAIDERIRGEYFRPECARWVRIAEAAGPGLERDAVRSELVRELRVALKNRIAEVEVEARIESWLPHFRDGTFGLCVADPSTGNGIATKELLQERLSTLTDNGSNPAPGGVSQTELLALIDDYDRSAMPFSPVEYPRSSRKRLVDDLRSKISMSYPA